MALRLAMFRNARSDKGCCLGFQRWVHAMSKQVPLYSSMDYCPTTSPPMVLPESENTDDSRSFSLIHGSLELMAVPKRKVSPHKRGIRNGPKALKPVPVIVRCKVCGQVKLPHFFCCGGRPKPNGQNGSVS